MRPDDPLLQRCRLVADADDPELAVFRDIRERDLAGREGFIAEGSVVLAELLVSERFRPTRLLLMRNRLAGLRALLDGLPMDVPVHVAEADVLEAIAGFAVHRGVLAHGERRRVGELSLPERLGALARSGGVVVAAVGIANHDNLGAIFRNAAAFGAGLVLVDATSCDPLYRKAIRVSVGSVLRLPFERVASGAAAVEMLGAAGFRCLALTPSGSIEARFEGEEPLALFLGAEGPGLPPELIARMEGLRIDMAPGFDSLNVATAAAVVLDRIYSARRSRR